MPVPSLVDLSTQMIIRNIQALDDVSDIAYDRIRHILRNIHNPAQLRRIELASPQIIGEDKELWLEFLKRDVPDYAEKLRAMGKIKSWHATYFTLLAETEARVAEDTEKLRQAMLGAANEKASHTSKLVNPSALPNLHKHTRIGPTGASRGTAAPSSGPKGSIFLEKARKNIRQMSIFAHRNASAKTQARPATAAAAAVASSSSSLSPPRPAASSSSLSVSSSTSGRFGISGQPGQTANGRFGRIGRIGRLGGSSGASGAMPLPKALLSAAEMRRLTLSATSTASAAPATATAASNSARSGPTTTTATTNAATTSAAAAGQQPRKKRPASPQPDSAMESPAYIPPRLVSRAATASAANPLMPSRQQQQQRRRPASGLPATTSSTATPPPPSAPPRPSSSAASSSSALPPSRTRASVAPSTAKRQRVA